MVLSSARIRAAIAFWLTPLVSPSVRTLAITFSCGARFRGPAESGITKSKKRTAKVNTPAHKTHFLCFAEIEAHFSFKGISMILLREFRAHGIVSLFVWLDVADNEVSFSSLARLESVATP